MRLEKEEIAELLIKYGAKVNAENDEEKTPLDCAIEQGILRKFLFYFKLKHAWRQIEKMVSVFEQQIAAQSYY